MRHHRPALPARDRALRARNNISMASESFRSFGLNLVHLRSCSYFEILYYHGVLRTPLGPAPIWRWSRRAMSVRATCGCRRGNR
jgi:hypothetical protein